MKGLKQHSATDQHKHPAAIASIDQNVRWNWILVANGASCEATNFRFGGIWSAGKGPSAAKLDRLRAVMTIPIYRRLWSTTQDHNTVGIRTMKNNHFVRGINIQTMSKRECNVTIIEGGICGGVVGRDARFGKTGYQLSYVTYTQNSRYG